jgi:crossover junction endodeoxyribonuclease RusA
MREGTEVKVWLPFPPSVNNLFSQGVVKGKVRRFPSRQYKAWRKEAVIRLLAAKLPRFSVPVVIKLALTPKDARARDADNYNKAVIDALVEARLVPADDSRWIKAVSAWWENPKAGGGVEVFIRPAKMEGRQKALNANERKALTRIKHAGVLLVSPKHHTSAAVMALMEKGYVRELPGLFKNVPQGFVALEAD